MSGKRSCRRRLLVNTGGVSSGGEVGGTEGSGFPEAMVSGPGRTACRVGRFFSGGAVVVLSCLFRGSGRRRHSVCSGPALGSCGVMLDVCLICFLSARGLREQDHGKHAQRRACASPINHFSERGLSSSSVDRDGWEEASHSGSTGSA